ncbi:hypothetical protein ES703_97197 [subsurface metagenome]
MMGNNLTKSLVVFRIKELVMDEHGKVLLGMDDYSRELARILRELLAAGSKRDRDRMLKLAQDIEKLAGAGNPD